MNYTAEKQRIDEEHAKMARGVFPFISKSRITILSEGFYRKYSAKYYGLTMMYDKQYEKTRAIMLGYYYIPDNYIILPSKTVLTDKKMKLLEHWLKQGYKLINNAPSISMHEFDPISREYEVAEYLYNKHKDDISSNKQKEGVSLS